jgi:undecaprenyl-diphosphatase
MNLHLVIVSIVEGLTEFIPVSSTAHIIIFSKIFNIDTTSEYIKFYSLFIQSGALLAGIVLFSKKIFSDKRMLTNIILSFIPTSVIGFLLYKLFKSLLAGNMVLIVTTLIVGGAVLIFLEKFFLKRIADTSGLADIKDVGRDSITSRDAVIIGIAQALAIVPGVSRSGATIAAGIFMGIKKSVIIEYTFILAIPTIAAAVAFDTYKSFDVIYSLNSYNELVIGFLVSFASAFILLNFFKNRLGRISLTMFGWYRIIVAVLIFLIFVY